VSVTERSTAALFRSPSKVSLNFAARDKPAITAKILVWPADPLDRHAKRLPLGRANGLYIFQIFKR
jgi:hypothetical protein